MAAVKQTTIERLLAEGKTTEQIVKYLIDNRIVSNGADARFMIAFEKGKLTSDVIGSPSPADKPA